MAIPEIFMALPVVLLWQLPWIASLVFAWLIYRRWRSPGARLTVLTLGLLVILAVVVPLVVPDAWGRVAFFPARDDWYTALAVSLLGNLASVIVVFFLGVALYRLMRDLAERRRQGPRGENEQHLSAGNFSQCLYVQSARLFKIGSGDESAQVVDDNGPGISGLGLAGGLCDNLEPGARH